MAESSINLTSATSPSIMSTAPTTELDAMPGVIVSANRFDDIDPFAQQLFHEDMVRWGSIWPWEFPQNGSKEVEERFLNEHFDPMTIHVQGYRFLKQVWYCLSIWNWEHRISLVEDWYWQQEDNLANLNDPTMRQYFLKDDVKLQTFFDQSWMDMYGEKFLNQVMRRIQKTASERKIKPNESTQPRSNLSVTIPANEAGKESITQSAPLAQPQHTPLPPDESTQRPSSRRATLSTIDRPQLPSPISTSVELHPQQARNPPHTTAAIPQDNPPQSRKRGNSGVKRFNNRGGYSHQPRQPSHFQDRDRNVQPFPPSQYGQPPPMVQGYPRGPPRAHGEFMPPPPHNQPPQPMQAHFQYVPGQHSQPGYFQHPMMSFTPQMQGQTPIYASDGTFQHYNNQQPGEYGFNNEMRSFSNDNFPVGRGNRRPSQGSCNGKVRGTGSMRGRGRGRGRESFHSDDRPGFPAGPPHQGQWHSGEQIGPGNQTQGQQPNVMNKKSWRSDSEQPQAFPNAHHTKENFAPPPSGMGPPGLSPAYYPPYVSPPPRHAGEMGLPQKPQYPSGGQFQQHRIDSPTTNTPVDSNRVIPGPTAPVQAREPTREETCDRERIGSQCIRANRLVAFNIPASVSEYELHDTFSAITPIMRVSRSHTTNKIGEPLVWILFANNHIAIQFLMMKPKVLFNQAFRVEVPRNYWDESHARYEDPTLPLTSRDYAGFNRDFSGSNRDFSGFNREFPGVGRLFQGLTAHHERGEVNENATIPPTTTETAPPGEADQSAETTPTPSGATTPKRKNNKKAKSQRKKAEDLRKASLALSTDLKQMEQAGEAEGPSTAGTPTGSRTNSKAPKSRKSKDKAEPNLEKEFVEKERTASVQTEVQSSSEPSFTRADDPTASRPEVKVSPPSSTEQESTKQTTAATQTSDQQSHSTQSFRDEKAAKEAKTKDVDNATDKKIEEPKAAPILSSGTPSKVEDSHVDDSFHTASGSPDSTKHEMPIDTQKPDEGQSTEPNETQVKANDAVPSEKVVEQVVSASAEKAAREPSTDEAVSPKTSKKAPVPQFPSKPKVIVSSPELKANEDEHKSEQRSIVPPTPAFATAPNTPAVGQEQTTPKQAAPEQTAPEQTHLEHTAAEQAALEPSTEAQVKLQAPPAKKIEKAKGPAETESFSQFGKKKKENKPKKGKKGTLKGKPKSGTASESSSRAVSIAAAPTDTSADEQKGGEVSDPKPSSEVGDAHAEQPMDQAPLSSETPTKRKGFGSFLHGLFPGGQKSQPSNKTRPDSTVSKSSLTKSKAPDLPPSNESESKVDDRLTSSFGEIEKGEQAASSMEEASAAPAPSIEASSTQVDESVATDIAKEHNNEQETSSAMGLGISNDPAEQTVQEGSAPKKKKKKALKKKNRASSADHLLLATTSSSPAVEKDDLSRVFQFKSGSPSAVTNLDDRSETSSHTAGRLTPTSDPVASPTLTQPSRKLPLRSTGAGHLMEAKKPGWKQHKRRIASRNTQDTDSNADDERTTTIILEPGDSSSNDQDTPTDTTTAVSPHGPKKETIYVYVGAPRIEDIDSEGEEADIYQNPSREQLEEMAIAELRRRKKEDEEKAKAEEEQKEKNKGGESSLYNPLALLSKCNIS